MVSTVGMILVAVVNPAGNKLLGVGGVQTCTDAISPLLVQLRNYDAQLAELTETRDTLQGLITAATD